LAEGQLFFSAVFFLLKGNISKIAFFAIDFLGYSFQPRTAYSKKRRKVFLGYDCAISISSRKRIADKLE
jgi:hypothetical protein